MGGVRMKIKAESFLEESEAEDEAIKTGAIVPYF